MLFRETGLNSILRTLGAHVQFVHVGGARLELSIGNRWRYSLLFVHRISDRLYFFFLLSNVGYSSTFFPGKSIVFLTILVLKNLFRIHLEFVLKKQCFKLCMRGSQTAWSSYSTGTSAPPTLRRVRVAQSHGESETRRSYDNGQFDSLAKSGQKTLKVIFIVSLLDVQHKKG